VWRVGWRHGGDHMMLRKDVFIFLFLKFRFKNPGLTTLEFRFLVGIGRSRVMIGRLFLNMVYEFLTGDEL
jgi:hypothetical protein